VDRRSNADGLIGFPATSSKAPMTIQNIIHGGGGSWPLTCILLYCSIPGPRYYGTRIYRIMDHGSWIMAYESFCSAAIQKV
jgi:hypothetical protein